MRERTFKRGIHPPEQKTTSDKEVVVIQPAKGEELVYPLLQHIGAPCEPVVEIGERVLVGQKIADSKAVLSAPVHASVSGVIKAFRPSITPSGVVVDSIVIENDAEMEEHSSLGIIDEGRDTKFNKDEFLGIIREAGVVGLGGAGFPTHVKLNPPGDKRIDYIIVNASECEPYLTTDHRVMVEEGERLKRGLCYILRAFPDSKGLIAIETNKPDAIENMRKLCADNERIQIVPLKPKYPQGSEKQLIYACTKREVPSGGLPADAGCIVDNVDTVIAIDRAIYRGRPLMRKIVTVAGGAVNNPGNFKVRLGMSYRSLVEATGGFKSDPYKIISGGPMMGVAMFTADVPIIKTSSAFLCFTEEEGQLPEERNCIRCAKCISHCPVNLMPLELNQFALSGETDLFIKNNGMDCIECGSCSYVCPAKRHLAQSIRFTRRSIMVQRKK